MRRTLVAAPVVAVALSFAALGLSRPAAARVPEVICPSQQISIWLWVHQRTEPAERPSYFRTIEPGCGGQPFGQLGHFYPSGCLLDRAPWEWLWTEPAWLCSLGSAA